MGFTQAFKDRQAGSPAPQSHIHVLTNGQEDCAEMLVPQETSPKKLLGILTEKIAKEEKELQWLLKAKAGSIEEAGKNGEAIKKLKASIEEDTAAINSFIPEASRNPRSPVYDETKKIFYIRSDDRTWTPVSEARARTEIEKMGFSYKRLGGGPCPADLALNDIAANRKVPYAGPVAGHLAGFRTFDRTKMLVTRDSEPYPAVKGDWSMLQGILERMLGDQIDYIYSWTKQNLEAHRDHRPVTSQLLILCGEVNCGKTFLQEAVFSELFGGSAYPGHYMGEKTDFNAELFHKPHQILSDHDGKVTHTERMAFGGYVKRSVGNTGQPCFIKNGLPVLLDPFWPISMSVNTDPVSRLKAIPPLDPDIRNKMIILLVASGLMPMPTAGKNKELFASRIRQDLPGFAWFLMNEYEIPTSIARPDRFGIEGYCHPEIEKHLFEMTPDQRLLDLFDEILTKMPDSKAIWGTLLSLEQHLKAASDEAKDLIRGNMMLEIMRRLKKSHPNKVHRTKHQGKRGWMIMAEGAGLQRGLGVTCLGESDKEGQWEDFEDEEG